MTSSAIDAMIAPLPERHDRLRIDGAFLYTADPARPVIVDGALLVEKDRIIAVGSREEIDACETGLPPAAGPARRIDASHSMILPGLVNNHWHESSALMALGTVTDDPDDSDTTSGGMADGADISAASGHFLQLLDLVESLPPELATLFALRSYAVQLRSGTTCVADFGSANRPGELAGAILATGIRGVVTQYGVDGHCPVGGARFMRTRDTDRMLAEMEAMMSRYAQHESGRLRAMPSALWQMAASDELLVGAEALARRFDTPWGSHLAGFANEAAATQHYFGPRAIERMYRLGLLSDRLISVHTAHADRDEFDWIVQSGLHLTYSPQKYGASGEAPVISTGLILDFLKTGAPVTFSSDGDVRPMGHMPEAMRMGWLQCNESGGDRSILTPMKTLAMTTRLPARSLGWASDIGTLAAGMKADFFTVRLDDWRYDAMRRPLDTFLIMGGSGDVDMVAVDGRILVQDRALTFIDEAALSRAFVDGVRGLAAQLGM